MKTSTIYLIAGGLALGGVAVLVLALRKSPEETETPIDVVPPTQGGGGVREFSCDKGNGFPLQFGSCGSNVEKWQQYLNQRRGENLSVDGKFFPISEFNFNVMVLPLLLPLKFKISNAPFSIVFAVTPSSLYNLPEL